MDVCIKCIKLKSFFVNNLNLVIVRIPLIYNFIWKYSMRGRFHRPINLFGPTLDGKIDTFWFSKNLGNLACTENEFSSDVCCLKTVQNIFLFWLFKWFKSHIKISSEYMLYACIWKDWNVHFCILWMMYKKYTRYTIINLYFSLIYSINS